MRWWCRIRGVVARTSSLTGAVYIYRVIREQSMASREGPGNLGQRFASRVRARPVGIETNLRASTMSVSHNLARCNLKGQ